MSCLQKIRPFRFLLVVFLFFINFKLDIPEILKSLADHGHMALSILENLGHVRISLVSHLKDLIVEILLRFVH